MRCVFFGSPEFAVASLQSLLSSSHEVLGVITQPDRPAGRGLKMEPPAVKKLAMERGLPILQPEKVNCEETYQFLEKLKPEILVVVAYGGFLGKRLLGFCALPPVNVHPSNLPDLRGAAPMQWALLKGYEQTGVSTQFMVKEMDAGDVLMQVPVSIGADENAKELQDRLKVIGGEILVKTLDGLADGSIKPRRQDGSKATFAPLLQKDQGRIRFTSTGAREIHNQIRGLFPWPGAFTHFQGKRIKILRSKISQEKFSGPPGAYFFREGRMWLQTCAGALEILELQPEGKRPLLPLEFENGIQSLEHRFQEEIS